MNNVDQLCINTLRFLSVDMVEQAKSGHPGLPLGAAPMAWTLWSRFLRHNPSDPKWPDRDRFVLSAGHGCALLYSLLHLTGYDLPLEELKRFRQWGSKTPGHPEYGLTPGVEATTGPLGQGFATAIGMAIAEQFLAGTFNREKFPVIDHSTYALVSDGDLMEGISSEAASLAGTMGLGKLVYLYDDNHVSLEGGTDLAFTEDVGRRFEAYHWNVFRVEDGNDVGALAETIARARTPTGRPSLVIVRTHLGYGSPRQDTKEAHGEPLGPEGVRSTKDKLGWPLEPTFLIPEAARAEGLRARTRGVQWQGEWTARWTDYQQRFPDAAEKLGRALRGELPPEWDRDLPEFVAADGSVATRDASAKVLQTLANRIPTLLGGSGDLAPSTKTLLPGTSDFGIHGGNGRNLHFGVRENAMVGIVSGMAVHGGLFPYGASFLQFSDYARPALRMAALMHAAEVIIFTHDSVGLGEDGPTHQPVEHLWSLRSIPGMTVIRPADANETAQAWRIALTRKGPVLLALTRQKIPVLDTAAYPVAAGAAHGGYVLRESDGKPPDIVLAGTGSEVSLVLAAADRLRTLGVAARVVSLPCVELFAEQSETYRLSVFPPGIPRLFVEAGTRVGWWKYVEGHGDVIGIERFGASAPGAVVLEKLGFTVDHVVERALAILPPPRVEAAR